VDLHQLATCEWREDHSQPDVVARGSTPTPPVRTRSPRRWRCCRATVTVPASSHGRDPHPVTVVRSAPRTPTHDGQCKAESVLDGFFARITVPTGVA
jgi:hypothetical protein